MASHDVRLERGAAEANWPTLIAASVALFMAIVDNLAVNVALPTIARDLDASTTQLQWIVSAFVLVFASLQITAGGLGDRFGRKRWFMGGIALFTASSFLASLAPTVETLIALRAIQGLGAAFILPLSLSIISITFPPEERGRALGSWSAISAFGLAVGPVLGGLLVQYASWHWIFLVNVPIGLLGFAVSAVAIRESREAGAAATDLPGTLLITGAIASLTWALIEVGDRGWGDPLILTGLAAAALLGVALVVVESAAPVPMIPLRFFRSTSFTGANLDTFVVSLLIAGFGFYSTLYLQNIHGFSPVQAGLAILPQVVMMMAAAPISGALVNRVGAARLVTAGMIVAGVGTLLYTRAGVSGGYGDLFPAYLVIGLGLAFVFAPTTTALFASVESSKSGVASAINGTVREIGVVFGVAFLGSLMNRAYQAHFDHTAQIQALRDDPASAPLQPAIQLIGSGMSYAGRVAADPALFPNLPPRVAATLRAASDDAFMAGMDRAILVSVACIVVTAIASYWFMRDADARLDLRGKAHPRAAASLRDGGDPRRQPDAGGPRRPGRDRGAGIGPQPASQRGCDLQDPGRVAALRGLARQPLPHRDCDP